MKNSTLERLFASCEKADRGGLLLEKFLKDKSNPIFSGADGILLHK
jgi:hypothetical protein